MKIIDYYPIGVLAHKSGVSIKAIRYYDEVGLLKPAQTSDAGYRLYGESEVFRLEKIAILRFLGASIQEIKEILDGNKSISEFLSSRNETLDLEIQRLGRLKKVLSESQDAIAQNVDPWSVMGKLERVIGMEEEERIQWWMHRWHKILGDSSLPKEFIDDWILDALESRKHLTDEKEERYILAVENGEEQKLAREMFGMLGKDRGTGVEQIKAELEDVANELRHAAESDSEVSTVQDAVGHYVSFLAGDGTDAAIRRALNTMSEPIFRRMFMAMDIKGETNRGEEIYQMILENLNLRLNGVS